MPTLYDVAHFVAWNGYAKDMIPYLGVDKAAWNNDEFWFPYAVNQLYKDNKTRIHMICHKMGSYKSDDSRIDWYNQINIDTYNPAERIKQLLAYGANPDIKDSQGFTPLHICCRNGWKGHKEIAEILIKAGADINARNKYGSTPLYLASRNNNIDIVKLLLANYAIINIPDDEGYYPIDLAAEQGRLEIMKLLINSGAAVTDKTFYKAIDTGQKDILKYLGTIRRAPADSISYAAWGDKTSMASTLARIGGDLNYTEDGRTLVERAVFDTDRALYDLCEAGADVNRTAVPNAMPPLFLVLMTTHLAGVKILCDNGANVNILYNIGNRGHHMSPIIYILDKQTFSDPDKTLLYEIFMILLPRSDLRLTDSNGDTPLEFAKKNGLTKYILAIGREALKRKFPA